MKMHYGCIVGIVTALLVWGTSSGFAQTPLFQQSQADMDGGAQVQTRGPVHEAFAETITFDPKPGMVVKQAPPEPIEELAPDQRPDGANVDWIPGYWAWDDERNDFLWISGVWRALPPGREWVPGYWGRSSRGYQWTPGLWADAQASEMEYLPEPPQTVEGGPNTAAPSMEHTWTPGCWVWHERRYAWRPGYWQIVHRDWDWIPAHYVCAPRGYVFVDGYWDYSVDRRGILYAPVYFDPAVSMRRDFSYSPKAVVNLSVFSDHLFVRPRDNHYYFGDYYASSYRNSGFFASFSFQSSRQGYDPIFARDRWQHQQDPDWERRIEADFRIRLDDESARPSRTLAEQNRLTTGELKSKARSTVVGALLDQLGRRADTPMRLQSLDAEEREKIAQRGKQVQDYREERQRLETAEPGVPSEIRSKDHGPTKVTIRKSPIVAKSRAGLGKEDSPPEKAKAPQPDLKVERKPRPDDDTHEHPKNP